MITNFQLYIYTLDEYKRFANYLPVKYNDDFVEEYAESDYIGIQVRLMLLRKYYSIGKNPGNVSFRSIVAEAQTTFHAYAEKLNELLVRYDEIEKQQIEHILSDGTKLNLYTTIEDEVYGLYLHADSKRIENLTRTKEGIRFVCTRKFVIELEQVLFALYDILKRCGETIEFTRDIDRAPILYLGNNKSSMQKITTSPYWRNVYGRDASDEDLMKLGEMATNEEKEILNLCIEFMEELKQFPLSVKKLRRYVHPFARRDWGDFSKAQSYFMSISNPGYSSKVRYSKKRELAYVRVFSRVDGAFITDEPHVFEDVNEFALAKWKKQWKIYSFGGHLESLYIYKQRT